MTSTFKYCPLCASLLDEISIDGASRLVCANQRCQYVYWQNPTPVVAALVELQEDYVLARNAAWPFGVFSLITGFLEKAEAPEHAVIREVKEELNLDANIEQFIGHYTYTQKNQLIIAYALKADGEINTNEEIAEVKRVPKAALNLEMFRKLTVTQAIVSDWLRRRTH